MILFNDATVVFEDGTYKDHLYILVDGKTIKKISDKKLDVSSCRVIDCKNKLLIPGLYNCHAHSPMSLLKGIGEDLTLNEWLNTKIYPAEDKLKDESVFAATSLSCAEMIRNGIVSFSDMYFFCPSIIEATSNAGMKANIGRCIVSFDESSDPEKDERVKEAIELFKNYHNFSDGRIKIDMALHAEYTNTQAMTEHMAHVCKELDAVMHIHLSETEKEHEECKIRRKGKTPTEFFESCGVFKNPTIAAHCVYITENDAKILSDHGATIAHNPVSNLKLASGVGDLKMWQRAHINTVLGTDGSASNNRLDILREMNTAALIHRGMTKDPGFPSAASILPMATVNGAYAQRRNGCGMIKEGANADLVLIDLDTVNNVPSYSPIYSLVYSATSSDVVLTMVDGKILYENGEFTTLDIEKIKFNVKKFTEEIL